MLAPKSLNLTVCLVDWGGGVFVGSPEDLPLATSELICHFVSESLHLIRYNDVTTTSKVSQGAAPLSTSCPCCLVCLEHIELPAKLLDYFLRKNKKNINQSSENVWSRSLTLCPFTGLVCDLLLRKS